MVVDKSKRNPLWTREEHILAFNLYNQIPFGTIHIHNPKIIQLSEVLGRSVGSVSRKLANFSRLDPALKARGIRGLEHGAKGEEDVWNEFADNPESLAFESQVLLAGRLGKPVETVAEIETDDIPPLGTERNAIVRTRVNQSFFRRRILALYENRCCITGLSVPELLVASHIIPWSEDIPNRLNPRNGLCLNALHDRAFDRGLMWIDGDLKVRFSNRVSNNKMVQIDWLIRFEGSSLILPSRFQPDKELLRRHAQRYAN
jgi:putative restriction endonuclease